MLIFVFGDVFGISSGPEVLFKTCVAMKFVDDNDPIVEIVVCRRRELFVAPAVSLLNNNRAEFDTSKVS